jgi:phosphohistidine phosphatase SixA
MTRLCLVGLVLTIAGCAAGPRPATFPKQVLLIRHAEKPDDDSPDLSPTGRKRAEALPTLFERGDFPAPDFIFAARASKNSDRSAQTVAPLAKKLKREVNASYANDDYDKLAAELLSDPRYEGKTVLICWHHGNLPELAEKLKGEGVPDKWKDGVFDRVWVLTYEQGKGKFSRRPQGLLPGDSEK